MWDACTVLWDGAAASGGFRDQGLGFRAHGPTMWVPTMWSLGLAVKGLLAL